MDRNGLRIFMCSKFLNLLTILRGIITSLNRLCTKKGRKHVVRRQVCDTIINALWRERYIVQVYSIRLTYHLLVIGTKLLENFFKPSNPWEMWHLPKTKRLQQLLAASYE